MVQALISGLTLLAGCGFIGGLYPVCFFVAHRIAAMCVLVVNERFTEA